MTAAIMVDDWNDRLARMHAECDSAPGVEEGIRSIYFNLREYALIYQDTWNMAVNTKEARKELVNGRSRRQMLVEQLGNAAQRLFDRFGVSCDPFLPDFISNSILAYVMKPDFDYEQLAGIFRKIIYGEITGGVERL